MNATLDKSNRSMQHAGERAVENLPEDVKWLLGLNEGNIVRGPLAQERRLKTDAE